MLIGLAEFVCMDESEGYILHVRMRLLACVCSQELVCLGAGGRPIRKAMNL